MASSSVSAMPLDVCTRNKSSVYVLISLFGFWDYFYTDFLVKRQNWNLNLRWGTKNRLFPASQKSYFFKLYLFGQASIWPKYFLPGRPWLRPKQSNPIWSTFSEKKKRNQISNLRTLLSPNPNVIFERSFRRCARRRRRRRWRGQDSPTSSQTWWARSMAASASSTA